MKHDPIRFNSMCCARTAALQGENEKRMWKPCWVSCRKNTLYPKPEAKIAPRAIQDRTKTEPKSTPDGPRRPLRDHLGAMIEKDLILKAPKWPLELQNEPKLRQNQKTNAKKTNTKNIAFPGMFFSRSLVILEPFLEWIREPLNLRKWAYGVGKTLIFTFWAFPNPPRKRTCQKVLKNTNLNWIWEAFPKQKCDTTLKKTSSNFWSRKSRKSRTSRKNLGNFWPRGESLPPPTRKEKQYGNAANKCNGI